MFFFRYNRRSHPSPAARRPYPGGHRPAPAPHAAGDSGPQGGRLVNAELAPETERPHLRYWDGEGDPPDIDVVLWIEPEGWQENWWYRDESKKLRLVKSPSINCIMVSCQWDKEQVVSFGNIVENLNERGLTRDAADPNEAMEAGFLDRIVLSEGTFWAIQCEDDKEHKAFLDRIFSIIEEECSDRLVWVHSDGSPEPKVLKSFLWAGPNAVAWALSAPNRYFGYALRPLAAYPVEGMATVQESYGLYIVETQKFHDFIYLQVPASWPPFHLPSGRGLARDDDNDNGIVWVDFETFKGTTDAVREMSLFGIEGAYRQWTEDGEHRDVTRLELGGHPEVYGVSETVEEGMPLRIFSWTLSVPIEQWNVLIFIHLVLKQGNLTDPLCEGVIEAMQQAVANIRIDEEAFLERVAPVH